MSSRTPARERFRGGSTQFEEQGRAYMQERLKLFAKVLTFITAPLYVVFRAADMAFGTPLLEAVSEAPSIIHICATVALLILWRIMASRELTLRQLRLFDVFAISDCLLACLATVYFMGPIQQTMTAWLMALFILARAVLVPSTAHRTVWLSVPAALAYAGLRLIEGEIVSLDHEPLAPQHLYVLTFVETSILGVGIALAATASLVTFRLRRQAYEAEQLGQYVIEDKIGEGGMGEVFRARHALLRRPTAVKLLRPDRLGEEALNRFEREVKLASRLTHPNSINIYDYGRTPDRVFYYAMELLTGADLEEIVEQAGPMSAARVIHVLEQVCGALGEAHGRGMLHRDIKPANLFLCERGGTLDVVKVLDYGLAKEMGEQEGGLTAVGQVLGTPYYLNPEALGAGAVGPASDIYSLGAVAYRVLAGRYVFVGDSIGSIIVDHLQTEPTPPSQHNPEVPQDLERVVLRCLEKDPARRPQTVGELRADLLACEAAGRWSQDDARAWWTEHMPDRLDERSE